MEMKSRRDFLRAAGYTVLGVSGSAPFIIASAMSSRREGGAPGSKGHHWALAIDTSKCREGCTACMDACHREHNVPEMDNAKEEVKWIWKEPLDHVFHEELTEFTSEELRERRIPVLCNHCDNPPCVRVCPTQATWKSPEGPVMMDQHRCIGCRYCLVGCPYGARSFNWKDPRPTLEKSPGGINSSYPTRTKGVVEKCTMCSERLARGIYKPACVEACEQVGCKAIIFGDLNDPQSEIRKIVASSFVARRKAELGTRPQVYYSL